LNLLAVTTAQLNHITA